MSLEEAAAPAAGPAPAPARSRRTRVNGSSRLGDLLFAGVARASTLLTLLILAALVCVLVQAALPSIRANGAKFLVSSEWRPNELEVQKRDAAGHVVIEDGEVVTERIAPDFGALPVIYGTAVSSLLALLFAVPIGFGAALFLVRMCKPRLGKPLSFLIEFLAAIPSIAYGMWGLMVLAPLLQDHA